MSERRFISVCKYLQGGCQGDGTSIQSHYFSWWCQALGQEAMSRNRCTEIPPEHKKELHCAGALDQIAQRCCRISVTGDTPEPSGHSPVPCALGGPCLSREVPYQPDPSCDSLNSDVLLICMWVVLALLKMKCAFLGDLYLMDLIPTEILLK